MCSKTVICPPEWGAHQAVWAGWPYLEDEWGTSFELAKLEIAGFIRALSLYVPVKVAIGSNRAQDEAYALLGDKVELCRVPTGDIWLRDTGPLFGRTEAGAPAAHRFQFNGWGGKYMMAGDAETASALAQAEGIDPVISDLILEGGNIEQDGVGRLLTVRACLLNPNRNPDWSEADAEAALKRAYGVSDVLWLEHGLTGDHTDGHVDNIARFVGPGHVLCQTASGEDDPNNAPLKITEEALAKTGLKVSTLPSPGRIEASDGSVLPASHLNFLITNGAVLMPVYEPVYSERAVEALARLFPDRDILALPSNHILEGGGGSFHCMTQQVPAYET